MLRIASSSIKRPVTMGAAEQEKPLVAFACPCLEEKRDNFHHHDLQHESPLQASNELSACQRAAVFAADAVKTHTMKMTQLQWYWWLPSMNKLCMFLSKSMMLQPSLPLLLQRISPSWTAITERSTSSGLFSKSFKNGILLECPHEPRCTHKEALVLVKYCVLVQYLVKVTNEWNECNT